VKSTVKPRWSRSMSRISVLSLLGYRDLRCRCLALQQPERQNADLTRTCHLDSNITLGSHAATSISGFHGSRILDSESLALETPNAETLRFQIFATCPSSDRWLRSNRGVVLRNFDVHAILPPSTPIRRCAMEMGPLCTCGLNPSQLLH
jgi:hypothetical protein